MGYIAAGYCSPSSNIVGACGVNAIQAGSGTGAPGSIKAIAYLLCKASDGFCDPSDPEAKANVIEFSNPAASLAYLQSQENNEDWLTGYQVNQWSVTIEGDGISPTEVTKLEKAEYSGSVIIDQGALPPLHVVQIF
jgi:hypothetical protein